MSKLLWFICVQYLAASGATKPRINVVWFKCTDLRTHDHAALKAAHADGLPVLHLFVLDPFWYEGKTRLCRFPKTGASRTRFQLEALEDLASRLESKGHRLNLRKNVSTAACFRELSNDFIINAVFAFHEICSEELRIQRRVQNVLQESGQGSLHLYWGYELLHHDDLPFDTTKDRAAFKEIEVFLKHVRAISPRPSALNEPRFLVGPEKAVHWHRACTGSLTVAEVMGENYLAAEDPGEDKNPRAELRWHGGETAALAWMQEYFWEEDRLVLDYVGATSMRSLYRSPLNDKATTKLSPWLAHGCLSPRVLYEEIQRYVSEYQKKSSTAQDIRDYKHSGIGLRNPYNVSHRIIRELLWRDFARFGSIEAGTSIFKICGRDKDIPQKRESGASRPPLSTWCWSSDQGLLQAWIDGRTGFPFIDSSMRELKTTGYCKHVGRLCAGWFLISDLGLDWRMGGEWFESILIDYEPTLNWFNWVYACLEPIDPEKIPRGQQQCLEILEASIIHDPDATYIKRWVPELSELPTILAREPWRLSPLGIQWAPKATSLRKMAFLRSFQASAVVQQDDAASHASGAKPSSGGNSFTALQRWRGLLSRCLSNLCALVSGRVLPRHTLSSPHRFRYGVDYPEPVIRPVSLMHAESAEARVRCARAISKEQREDELAWLGRSSQRSSFNNKRRETFLQRVKMNFQAHKALRGSIK
eukprot:TRINITY_DN87539_c0_g1_i1.p1 TRINITY_DN87539_c0_g1~~TRINITY_DN87539_c0_g1_i1.p1  ORF type:complete len:702 (+),score=76.14 TRINITY_DN87539_c0_g1_i1:145-2250(+)